MKSSRLQGALFALITLITIPMVSSTALALDAQDVRNLHDTGLDAGTIINVIRGTTEPLEMTADDVNAMETDGLPAAIIAELRMQLGIATTDPGGGTPSLQTELDEQRRLEAERQRIEQQRLNAEREAMRAELDAERARGTTADTAFQGLRRAQSLADEGECMSAAAVYNRFIEEMIPDPSSPEYYEAKFGLVSSLHCAGLRDAIRADALEVALMGSGRQHFEEAVSILHDVVTEAGFNSPRIADLSNEIIADFSPGFQDEFNYFLGRFYYDAGELHQALSYLGEIDLNGDYGARGRFLASVIMINPEIQEYASAVEALQYAVMAADMESEIDRDVAENAYLALARVAYQIGDFGGALYYYQKIPQTSSRWTTALFESGWSYFLTGDFNRAIGQFHALHGPYHNHRFFPDLYVLEAAGYLYSCNIDEAYESVATFEEEIGTLRDEVREFVAEATDPMVYYRAVFEPEVARESGDPLFPELARNVVMGDADFNRLFRIINQLERETSVLGPDVDLFGERGELTLQLIEGDLNNRRLEVAVLIHDVMRDLVDELDDWWFRSQEVTIEIQDLERRYLQVILEGGTGAITEGTTFMVLADDWQFWPWEGEYWLDEVGSYRANLTTRCPDDVQF